MYKKVALVSLPRQDLYRPPAALSVLAAICEKENVVYTINDFNLWLSNNIEQDIWQKIDDNWNMVNSVSSAKGTEWFLKFQEKLNEYVVNILNQTPCLIAISVFTDQSAHCALEFISSIRKRNTTVDIVIGGTGINAVLSQVSPVPLCQWLIEKKLINYYVSGEGEIAFTHLLNKNTNYIGINTADSIQIDELDQLPVPSYQKFNLTDYNYFKHFGKPSLMITGSRGCVRSCTFCDIGNFWPKFRFRSGVSIANEIYTTWQKTGVDDYEFSDSLINGNVKEFRRFNKELIRLKQVDSKFKISYKGQFICRSSSSFTESDYHNMKQAGCDYIYVGVETFSDKVRFDMAKKFSNADLDFHLAQCAKFRIPNSFLMLVGYPTETESDHQQNLKYLKKYQLYAKSGIIQLITFGFTAGILNHTPLYDMKQDLSIVSEFDDFSHPSNWVSLKNASLTLKERVRRWTELTELASDLGYRLPRIAPAVSRLSDLLTRHLLDKSKVLIPIKPV